jgi:hypothetical protein
MILNASYKFWYYKNQKFSGKAGFEILEPAFVLLFC